MERSFDNFTDENFEYLKNKVFEVYSDANKIIKRTVSNVINTFIRLGGIDLWPKLLELLISKLNKEADYENCMETIKFILEDSGAYVEFKNKNVYLFFLKFIKSKFFIFKFYLFYLFITN